MNHNADASPPLAQGNNAAECRQSFEAVIVVEGEHDRQAVLRAVQADCVVTGGHALTTELLGRLRLLSERRGLIILTDPDHTGERIRRVLAKHFPMAQHAYVPRLEATARQDIGIENASVASIQAALASVQTPGLAENTSQPAFSPLSWSSYLRLGLTGNPNSAAKRDRLGALLGIGHGSARTFWNKLNSYRVPWTQICAALATIESQEAAQHSQAILNDNPEFDSQCCIHDMEVKR